jgi:hypothetical protein
VAAVLLSVLWAGRAEAYVDPGTGALLWQLLLATFVGFFFYVRRFLGSVARRARDICLGRRKRDG